MSHKSASNPEGFERTSVRSDLAAETVTHNRNDSDTDTGRIQVRCPTCHTPIEIAVDTSFTDLTCGSCGSHFSLVDQSQATDLAPSIAKLGRFELIEPLGVGSFGAVWKARDKELDRTVAIKVPVRGGMTPEDQEKFLREARAAAQLRHPNIVSVHEVGREGDSVFIVSDFIRGVTLGDWLTGQQLTSREAADLCANIAEALHHAHEKGVVHRDLKPANIMIDGVGQPHIMDFGLASRDMGEATVTIEGRPLGTPAYMSPEQAQGNAHNADRRSDVYSLGVILFQLLTAELPFRGNARMLVHQAIHDEPPSPRKLNANVPKDLETITLKCLEKDPGRRYQSAHALSTELRRFLAGEPIQARPIGRLERAWRWGKHRPAMAALLALLACVAVVGPLVAVQQAMLRLQRDKLFAEKEIALSQLDEKNAELQNQLADNIFERATVEYDDGRIPQSIAMLATAHATATAENPLRAAFRNLLSGWSTIAPQPLLHEQTVRTVAFSPDGNTVATGSYDKTLRLWEAATGKPIFGPLMHDTGVRALAFSPDGKTLITGSEDTFARIWDITTGKQVGRPLDHGAGIRTLAYSPDGRFVVTAGDDSTARDWGIESREESGQPLTHEGVIRSVAFSSNGQLLATGSEDKTARIWSLQDRTHTHSNLK